MDKNIQNRTNILSTAILRALGKNKSGEVRSSNLRDLDVKSYPPKAHCSENHISAPWGCCAPKFLHSEENDPVLIAHPPPGTGPFTTFFKGGIKNWLKM